MSRECEEFVSNKNVYKFTVVRNPYARLVSCYIDIVHGVDWRILPSYISCMKDRYINSSIIKNRCILGLNTCGNISFNDFISSLENRTYEMNSNTEHWLPLYQVSCIDHIKYDAIGKLEDLTEFLFKEIQPRLGGVIARRPLTLLSNLRKKNITKIRYDWKSYYTVGLANRVYRLYEKDFDLFKYVKSIH